MTVRGHREKRSRAPRETSSLEAVHEEQHRSFEAFLEVLHDELERPRVFHYVVLGLEDAVVRHLKVEEEQVLEHYRRCVPDPPPPARPGEYQQDHTLLRQALEGLLDGALHVHFGRLAPALLRQRVAALDDLLEHHDQRESDHLYPALQKTLSSSTLDDLTRALQQARGDDVAALRATAVSLAAHPAHELLEAPYRAWLAGLALPGSLPLLPLDAGPRARAALPRLQERDLRLLEEFRRLPPQDRRSRAREERRVDETLRSTLRFAMKAFLEAARPGGSP